MSGRDPRPSPMRLVPPALAWFAACGRATSPAADAADLPVLVVDTIPILDIPGTNSAGEASFGEVAGAIRLSDGQILVADRPQRRMTVLSPAGSIVRQYSLPATPTQPAPIQVACSWTGTFAMLVTPRVVPTIDLATGESPPPARGPLYLADAQGNARELVDDVVYGEIRPLGRFTSLVVTEERVYLGTKDSAFVDQYSVEGVRGFALPVGVASRPATAAHYERAIEAQAALFAGASDRAAAHQVLRRIPMPRNVPLYGPLFTDPDGVLWVVVSIPVTGRPGCDASRAARRPRTSSSPVR